MKISDIQKAVCEEFGITLAMMLSPRRDIEYARPRHVAMGLAREITKKSYPTLAREFKRKDHTTVIHGVRRYWEFLEDEGLAAMIYKIEKRLR